MSPFFWAGEGHNKSGGDAPGSFLTSPRYCDERPSETAAIDTSILPAGSDKRTKKVLNFCEPRAKSSVAG